MRGQGAGWLAGADEAGSNFTFLIFFCCARRIDFLSLFSGRWLERAVPRFFRAIG